MLSEQNRAKLDGIIEKLDAAGAPVEDVQAIVADFKAKYDEPDQAAPARPSARGGAGANWSPPAAEPSTKDALFPRGTKAAAEGAGAVRGGLATTLDLLSLPGRAAASLPALAPGGETYRQALARTEGKAGTPGGSVAKFGGDVVRSPATAVTAAIGGPLAGVVGGAMAGAVGAVPKLASLALQGAAAGAPAVATGQAEHLAAGEPVSPREMAVETALNTAIPVAGSKAASAVRGLADFGGKFFKRSASAMAGPSQEALEVASTKAGRETLKQSANTQLRTARDMLDKIDNFDQYIPEAADINAALQKMPAIPLVKVANALKAHIIYKPATPAEVSGNKQIQQMYDLLQNMWSPKRGFAMPALELRNLRQRFDKFVEGAFDKDYHDQVEQAVIAARSAIKDDLIGAAKQTGNADYERLMRVLANKMDAVQELKSMTKIGSGGKTAKEARLQSFLDNLFGKNKEAQRELVSKIGAIFGQDFLQESRLARLASEFGPEGVPGLLPTQTTGRSLLGGNVLGSLATGIVTGNPLAAIPATVGALAGSPALASRTIGAGRAVATAAGKATRAATPVARVVAPTVVGETVQPPETEEQRQRRLSLASMGGLGR